MGSIIGHRIDYNGVGALRGQQHTPSKNLTHEPPPPNPALPLGNRNPQMIYFSCFRIAPVILCTGTVKAREQSKLSNYSVSWELPWTDSESLKTWRLHSEWSGTSKGLMRWLVRQLLQRFYSYSFFSSCTTSSRFPNCCAAVLWLVWSAQTCSGSPSVTTGEKKKL